MKTCPVCNGPVDEADATCPQCGFRLSGTTQQFEPIALSGEKAPAPAAEAPQPLRLKVVRGPQQIDTVYELEQREMVVGRSPRCDIFLNDMTVSRNHAVVTPVGAEYAIRDTNSFNGVWVNNENVTQAVLARGDAAQIGSFVLIVE